MAALEPDPAGGEEVDMPSTWYETYLRRIEEKRIAEAQGKNGPRWMDGWLNISTLFNIVCKVENLSFCLI